MQLLKYHLHTEGAEVNEQWRTSPGFKEEARFKFYSASRKAEPVIYHFHLFHLMISSRIISHCWSTNIEHPLAPNCKTKKIWKRVSKRNLWMFCCKLCQNEYSNIWRLYLISSFLTTTSAGGIGLLSLVCCCFLVFLLQLDSGCNQISFSPFIWVNISLCSGFKWNQPHFAAFVWWES